MRVESGFECIACRMLVVVERLDCVLKIACCYARVFGKSIVLIEIRAKDIEYPCKLCAEKRLRNTITLGEGLLVMRIIHTGYMIAFAIPD